jgi:hypothetical protein
MRQVSKEPMYGLARASVTVGEAIYNLRAALDYTIFDVAWACNGMRLVEWTQFPIDDDPETFWLRPKGGTHSRGHVVRAYLRKVPAPIVEKVREYQPFAGCWWTGPLRDLSNPDKHRSPIGLAVTGAPEIRDVEPSGYIDPETGVEWMQATADLMTVVSFEEFPQFPIVNHLAFVQREVHAFVLDVAPGFTITPRARA